MICRVLKPATGPRASARAGIPYLGYIVLLPVCRSHNRLHILAPGSSRRGVPANDWPGVISVAPSAGWYALSTCVYGRSWRWHTTLRGGIYRGVQTTVSPATRGRYMYHVAACICALLAWGGAESRIVKEKLRAQ